MLASQKQQIINLFQAALAPIVAGTGLNRMSHWNARATLRMAISLAISPCNSQSS